MVAVEKNNKNKSILLFNPETMFGNLLVLLIFFHCDCEMNEINHLGATSTSICTKICGNIIYLYIIKHSIIMNWV